MHAEFSYVRQGLAKQLKAADKQGAATTIVVGSETVGRRMVQVKEMADGKTRELSLDALLTEPRQALRAGR